MRKNRNMVAAFFTPEKVESMRPYIQATVNEILDTMRLKGCAGHSVDLVANFCLPVPSHVSFLASAPFHGTGYGWARCLVRDP